MYLQGRYMSSMPEEYLFSMTWHFFYESKPLEWWHMTLSLKNKNKNKKLFKAALRARLICKRSNERKEWDLAGRIALMTWQGSRVSTKFYLTQLRYLLPTVPSQQWIFSFASKIKNNSAVNWLTCFLKKHKIKKLKKIKIPATCNNIIACFDQLLLYCKYHRRYLTEWNNIDVWPALCWICQPLKYSHVSRTHWSRSEI